jgi:hypothetical protein
MRLVRYVLLVGACFSVCASGLPAAGKIEPREGAAGKKAGEKKRRDDWVLPKAGFERLRKKSLPAIVLFDLPQPPSGESEKNDPASESFLDSHFSKAGLRRVLRKFVLIRVSREDLEKKYPAAVKHPPGLAGAAVTLGQRLGIVGDQGEVVVLSYWEDDVLRYGKKLPKFSVLKKELKHIWRVNQIYAHRARKVNAVLERSRYAFKLKHQREAVLAIRMLEPKKEQKLMDPVLKKRVNDAIREYRGLADTAITDAGKLEKKKKLAEALEAYDDIATNFPFQDTIVFTSKKKSELLRKLTLGRAGRGPR